MNMWRLISLLWLIILPSCMKTEVLNAPAEKEAVVEKRKKGFPKDTTERQDTTRKPIEFNPSVEEWKED